MEALLGDALLGHTDLGHGKSRRGPRRAARHGTSLDGWHAIDCVHGAHQTPERLAPTGNALQQHHLARQVHQHVSHTTQARGADGRPHGVQVPRPDAQGVVRSAQLTEQRGNCRGYSHFDALRVRHLSVAWRPRSVSVMLVVPPRVRSARDGIRRRHGALRSQARRWGRLGGRRRWDLVLHGECGTPRPHSTRHVHVRVIHPCSRSHGHGPICGLVVFMTRTDVQLGAAHGHDRRPDGPSARGNRRAVRGARAP